MTLALVAGVLVTLGAGTYRWQALPLGPSFLLFGAGLLAAVVSVLLYGFRLVNILVRHQPGRVGLAAAGLVLAFIVLAIPASVVVSASRASQGLPAIHDITTDTLDPPRFVDVLPLRAGAPNTAEYGGPDVALQQQKAYPDLGPVHVAEPPQVVFDRALAVVRDLGWDLVAAKPDEGRIEATDTTFWFRFKDDVVIRLRPGDGGTRVDVRSVSRVGGGDVGTNAGRIRAYLARLKDRT